MKKKEEKMKQMAKEGALENKKMLVYMSRPQNTI